MLSVISSLDRQGVVRDIDCHNNIYDKTFGLRYFEIRNNTVYLLEINQFSEYVLVINGNINCSIVYVYNANYQRIVLMLLLITNSLPKLFFRTDLFLLIL